MRLHGIALLLLAALPLAAPLRAQSTPLGWPLGCYTTTTALLPGATKPSSFNPPERFRLDTLTGQPKGPDTRTAYLMIPIPTPPPATSRSFLGDATGSVVGDTLIINWRVGRASSTLFLGKGRDTLTGHLRVNPDAGIANAPPPIAKVVAVRCD